MGKIKPDGKGCVLVVVDAQNSLMSVIRDPNRIERNVPILINLSKRLDIPVVATCY